MTLNIEQDEYLPNVTSKAGVRVVIKLGNPQSHFPFPEDVGVDVSVGMSTSIGIRKVYICHSYDFSRADIDFEHRTR